MISGRSPSGSGYSAEPSIPNAAVPSVGWKQHDPGEPGYDRYTCRRCTWVNPDRTHKKGTAAGHDEWFPSMSAFEHFKRTGVRAWLGGSLCDTIAIEAQPGRDAQQLDGEAAKARPEGIAHASATKENG